MFAERITWPPWMMFVGDAVRRTLREELTVRPRDTVAVEAPAVPVTMRV